MITRRSLLAQAVAAPFAAAAAKRPPNILFITADDMNWDTPGCFGGRVPGITPNIDRLAAQGMRFERAHVTVAVCQPSRSVLMTGRYPYRNGAEGFGPIRTDVPTLQEQLHAAGYLNGIMAKNDHLAPRAKFCWDFYIRPEELGQGRSPELYYRYTKDFLASAAAAGKPFFLMANSQDPHRPFAGSGDELESFGRHMPVSRMIAPPEAVVPGFLPDIPGVRREVAQYLTSAHRCDETVGQVLRALEESGASGNTLVMFLSDNGMAFPYSKTNCYFASTRTPWIVRWPGRVKAGSVNRREFISGIDYMPTILEAAGLRPVEGVDGRSFVPLLSGRAQKGRERVFTMFHETSARVRYEMRAVVEGRFGYIFNAWADGKTAFRNESQSGLSFPAMREAAKTDARIAGRVNFFLYRTPEEFYDFSADPSGLNNLIGDPKYAGEIERLRRTLHANMATTGDILRKAFEQRVRL